MSLDEFLKEKQTQEEANEASKKKDFHDKCILILGKIKEKSEEKYHELSHLFHSRFSSPNIQRKVIMGFYAQLMNEMRALDPTPTLTQAATNLKQEVSSTVQATKQKAKDLIEKVEQAKQQVQEKSKSVKKEASKKPAAKKAKKSAAKKAPAKAKKVVAKKASTATAKKKTAKSAGSAKKKSASKRK
ncbi:MAG: hypothetical protein HYV97_07170 [Bdellovibrio sp.]|nr:hypothetical protein [Bdellovibrio sp.]